MLDGTVLYTSAICYCLLGVAWVVSWMVVVWGRVAILLPNFRWKTMIQEIDLTCEHGLSS